MKKNCIIFDRYAEKKITKILSNFSPTHNVSRHENAMTKRDNG